MTRSKKLNVFALILAVLLFAYTILLAGMFFWALLTSLKTPLAFDLNKGWFSKSFKDYTLDNYALSLKEVRKPAMIGGREYYIFLTEMFSNSFLYAVGCAFFATITPCLVAYVTAKYNSPFNKVVYWIVIFVMVTPIVGSLPSQIEMSKNLGLYDSHIGLWIMSATFLGTYYLVFYSMFKGLSWEYAEAAFIDGASHLKVMTKIMLPLVKTTIGVVMLLNFIGRWNDYQTSLIFLPNSPTAAVGVYYFSQAGGNSSRSIPVLVSGGMLLLLPVLILFLIFRNKLVGNLTIGGIKG